MKSIIRKFLSLSLAVVLAAAPLNALASDALGDDLASSSVEVNERTELNAGTFWSNTYSDLRQENYVVYSPNARVKPIVSGGDYTTQLTTVSTAAKKLEARGYRVVAGINGDYYDTATGIPLGSMMTEGVLRNASSEYYAIGFRDDGSTVMGKPSLRITAQSDYGCSLTVTAFNYVRQSSFGIYLYDSTFNARATTGTSEEGVDVVCSAVGGSLGLNGSLTLVVEQVIEGGKDTPVGAGQYVLSSNLKAAGYVEQLRALQPGERLTLSVSANGSEWNGVTNMIGALYQLVDNGQVCSGLVNGAAPRTAVGLKRDGSLVLYTIDGRQSGYSIGATLTQVAERMIELGCVTALSLDGGGSTTLCVTLPEDGNAGVYNTPSEGSLRAVTNHIFLVASNEPSGTLDHIALRTESDRVLAGAQVLLRAAAIDTNYIPMDKEVSIASDRGSVRTDELGNTVLTAPKTAGTVTVGAKVGGKYTTAELRVVETPDEIRLGKSGTLTELRVSPGASVELTAQAYQNHLSLLAQNSCFTWTTEGGVGTVDENGVFTAAGHAAYGSPTVRAGETTRTIPVYVTSDPLVLLDGFEGEQTVLTQNTDKSFVRFGSASARWDYRAENVPENAEELLLSVERTYAVPSGYDRVTLWVYGDGQRETLALTTDAGETNAAVIDFTGWQQLTFTLPDKAASITGFALRLPSALSGTLYLDQLVAAREGMSDTAAPEISVSLSEDGTALTGKVFDAVDGGSLATLRITLDGKALSFTYDHQTGALHAALPAADGKAHRIAVIAGDASGNLARTGLSITPSELSAAFPDTDGHWANAAVSFLKASGVTTGDDLGNFNPDSPITRQEFAVLLCRWLAPAQDTSSVELPFADSNRIADWAKDGVHAMYALGVTKGSYDGYGRLCFLPTATISRQEALTMLGRLLELGYAAPEWSFTDSDAIADWAREHINTLCAIGALSGYADGGIHPTEPITRAQVAATLFSMT